MGDFFGKKGIFARLFANTMEQMLEAELSDNLGYDRYEVEGRNSGNNCNGHYDKKLRTSNGDVKIQAPCDRTDQVDKSISHLGLDLFKYSWKNNSPLQVFFYFHPSLFYVHVRQKNE